VTLVDSPEAAEAAKLPPLVDPNQKVIEELTDSEKYLAAILLDRSGIDLAEFCVTDETRPDNCYRAYPHQWAWWRDDEPRQLDQSSRDVGKSEGIINRGCAFPPNNPGEEMVLVAPEASHMDSLTDRFEARLRSVRLLREMLVSGRAGVNHRPFKALFANGARVYSRLPQRSGLGLKGVHAMTLEVDEAQDISELAWKEMPETVRKEIPGAKWYIHGVSKGVRGTFMDWSEPGSGWKVHRITAMHKPSWSPEVRAQKEKDYGSAESGDYKRNVLGEHGSTMNRIFVLSHLMAGVDTNEGSEYNQGEYCRIFVNGDQVQARAEDASGRDADIGLSTDEQAVALIDLVNLPPAHTANYALFWGGMDVGLVGDPSEILIFAEYSPDARERQRDKRAEIATPDVGQSRFKLLTRVQLRLLPTPLQAELIMWMIDHYRPRGFAMDRTGLGLPLFQELQKRAASSRLFDVAEGNDPVAVTKARQALTLIKGYGFAEKVVVAIDDAKAEALHIDDPIEVIEKAGIRRVAKDAATDELRVLVDNRRILLPYDPDLINQWNGQTMAHSQEPIDAYGKRRMVYSAGIFHVLDAGRMFALGVAQQPIEQLLKAGSPKAAPVYDYFG
jgi:hypothetical protein